MGLSEEQIRKEIAENPRSDTVSRAVYHQNRLRFHSEIRVTPELAQPLADFLAFVGNILPKDKFKIFKTLLRWPLRSIGVTDSIYSKLFQIFSGRNPVRQFQFSSPEMSDDWEEYRKSVLGEPSVWETVGWEMFRTSINSILVVDLPREQETGLPRPYYFWLQIDRVLTFRADPHTGVMDFLVFREGDDMAVVLDDERYRVYEYSDGNIIGMPLVDNPHSLGYCPARFFWTEPLNVSDPDVKRSPLSKELEALDWYLFFSMSKRHLDLYGSYPIYSGYQQECDWSNEESGDYCDGGYIRNASGHYVYDAAGLLMPCPKCGRKRIIGAGSFVEVPVPTDGQPDLRNPVQMLSVDRDSLDYQREEVDKLETEIITSVVGTDSGVLETEAVNEKQVAATFESRENVLARIKRGFESAQLFVDSTACRLRYGEAFISATIDYGTDFFTVSVSDLRKAYAEARSSGASESELESMRRRIMETEYRSDPMMMQRMLMLHDIEPMSGMSRSEVLNLRNAGVIDDVEFRLKMDFPGYLGRFERENLNILEYASGLPYADRIDIIKEKLREYVNQDKGGD